MGIPHGFSFLSRIIYKGYSEKLTTMKGTTLTQNQNDNILLHLEWETKFAAAVVTAGMTKK
jgi:hypothetical protein